MTEYSPTFSKQGTLIAACLLTAEYVLHTLFYSYANPDLWENTIPHKYILYITLLLAGVVAIVVVKRNEEQSEVAYNARNFADFRMNLLLTLGLAIFCVGTFILYNILKARLFNSTIIGPFVDNNLYVASASNGLNIINHIFYPVLMTFIFQGFLLNGITQEVGFRKANIITSLFYGFWFGDILGATIYNLFMNHVYEKSKNIFYPAALSVITNIVFVGAYILKDEIWFLKASAPEYYTEIVKGLITMIIMSPIAAKVVREAFSKTAAIA